ncbi:mercury resistance system transport protein MerF [Gloeomargaritales cyanobacterium VI4D9]|nr:mercury resistance system transport protein MerF [Gloeomargaritales cyanobacterium VI4D9]
MLQVGEVSHKLGLNPQTLYFYERIGLIPKPKRTESGYRLYEEQDLERLAFITRAKALGLTLDEIKEILLLQKGEVPICHEIHSKLVSKVSQIEAAIAQLQELKSELLPLIQHCEKNFSETGESANCIVFQDKPLSFWASVSGTVIVALCCFTPVLAVTLSAIGLGAVVGYLDYVLLPALVVMCVVTFLSYRRYRRCDKC